MKKKTLLGLGLCLILCSFGYKYSNQLPPPAKTGAPGDGQCTDCHAGSAMNGGNVNQITFSGANNEYEPGVTYQMSLTLNGASGKNGFQIVALRNSDDTGVGTWITSGGDVAVLTHSGKEYLSHSTNGVSQATWNFEWTAPSTSQGSITFYIASNISNSNGMASGDDIYNSSFTISPGASNVLDVKSQAIKVHYKKSSNQIVVKSKAELNGQVNVELMDISGKLMERITIQNPESEWILNLKKEYQSGVYLLLIRTDNRQMVQKIKI